jgi:hypothetical protein
MSGITEEADLLTGITRIAAITAPSTQSHMALMLPPLGLDFAALVDLCAATS